MNIKSTISSVRLSISQGNICRVMAFFMVNVLDLPQFSTYGGILNNITFVSLSPTWFAIFLEVTFIFF